jgi:TetR/AcrR family tetracycline transcriptional repressor
MAKIRREEVIAAGLDLLNEVGLDGLSTRRLAQRLGVESPTLYWHFRDKATLLGEMSAFVMAHRYNTPVPDDTQRWPEWFTQNAREFRNALLAFRDGARLHAGSKPNATELERVELKIQYLMRAGIPRNEALMAMVAAGQFTLGCVMEEQARQDFDMPGADAGLPVVTRSAGDLAHVVDGVTAHGNFAFEFGLKLFVAGLRERTRGMAH